ESRRGTALPRRSGTSSSSRCRGSPRRCGPRPGSTSRPPIFRGRWSESAGKLSSSRCPALPPAPPTACGRSSSCWRMPAIWCAVNHMDILLPEAAAEPSRSSAASVRPGIDVLLDDPSPIAGRRIGLITNPSGVTSAGVPTWKALFESGAGKLFRLFGPEHGVDGGAIHKEAGGDANHPPPRLPAVSLYGATCDTLRPRREDLAGLDAIVFDVADVGARYYTYNWTMMLAMEACAEAGLRLVVCDRPNPIGGAVEGAPQEE